MKAYVLARVLPSDTLFHINTFIFEYFHDVIKRAYYKKVLIKTTIAQFFIHNRRLFDQYGYYPIYKFKNFYSIITAMDKYLNGHEDFNFWYRIIINIDKTLNLQLQLLNYNIDIIYPFSYSDLINIATSLRVRFLI